MPALPSGTVTFLFTDLEGSSRRWDRDRAAMERALARHDDLLRQAVEAHHGYVFSTAGDAFFVAFTSPDDALAAAIYAQRALAAEDWAAVAPGFAPLAVRMGLHTGLAELRDGDYFGPPLNRAARLMSAGHGGQVLLSLATQQLVRDRLPHGVTLRDLGAHRLKDLRFAEHIYQLVVAGLADVATPPTTAEALPARDKALADADFLPPECPYRGLLAFRPEDARFFFGREVFTARLVAAVTAKPMVGVIGPSGSGKSSVVSAGMLPALQQGAPKTGTGADTGAGKWTVLRLRPGADPFDAIASVLVPHLEPDMSHTARLVETARLAQALVAGTLDVRKVVASIRAASPALGPVLFVIDQFEELYTLCPDARIQRAFQDLVFAAAHHGNGSERGAVKLALTLRADFMGHATAYRPFADAIQDHNVILGPMNREELTTAIVKPAELQGRAFESGLVERILADVGEEAGQLPLLEFALTKLWERQQGGWLTHEAYEAIGRVEGAVARHADAVFDDLAGAEKTGCRRVFVQMVRPGEGTEDTRRLATKEELGEDWPLVRRLADARLVVTNRDAASGRETVEVVHEALIRSWQRLREWMNADRHFRMWQERLRFAARQWEATGRDEGALLRGVPLGEAEEWLTERAGDLAEGERAFVAAGLAVRDREAREREARVEREMAVARQLRRLAVGLAGALAVAAVLAVMAMVSRQQAARDARFAQARELAAAALVNLEVDPERSALLALQAVSVTQRADGIVLPEVVTTLHRAVPALHVRYLLGHHGAVLSAAYSSDGTRIATAGADNAAKIWDTATGREISVLRGRGDAVPRIVFSPDGQHIATADGDAVVHVWDAAMRHALLTLTGHGDKVISIRYSPDGRWIATRSDDKTTKIWDAATGRELYTVSSYHGESPPVVFSPDGQRSATQSDDNTTKIRDAATGRELFAITGHGDEAPFVAFSPDGQRIATDNNERIARVWDARTGRELFTLEGHSDVVQDVVFSPDSSRIATASKDKTAKIWDAGTGRELLTLAGHGEMVVQLAYSPGGDRLATGSPDKRVRIWDAESGMLLGTRIGHTGQISGRTPFSPDGQTLLSFAHGDPNARVWDLAPDREVMAPDGQYSADVAFSPDNRWFATTITHTAVLRDASTGREIRRFSGHTEDVLDVDFSPDGQRLATAGSKDMTARVWDVATGKSMVTLCCHEAYVQQVTFSPDGRHVATASWDKTAKVWDAATGKLVQTLEGHTEAVHAVVYSPDGNKLATVSDDATARLWDAATGKLDRTLVGHGEPVSYAWFSPDGRRLATASDDDTVGIWDVATGKRVRTIDGLMGGVFYIAYSPDGLLLVGVGTNGPAKVWDAESGSELFSLAGEASDAVALAISPDGGRLLMASNAGTGMYLLRLPDLVALAHSRLTRTLTPEECRLYLHTDACPADMWRP